jgi:hypothetical protein
VATPPRGQGKPYNDIADPTEADKALARTVFPHWDELKAAGTQAPVQQFGAPAGQQPQAAPVHPSQQQGAYAYGQQPPPVAQPPYQAPGQWTPPPGQAPYPSY